ncbi:hypothetical protein [Actinoallomurus soli]|uniref:hypothetical protein n=1 Tax=Actinoallomurus soli TaxID=2952535 RepID=UPI002093C7DD|nr:hypothetical protein [Actinoallomurus soli]MCO5968462.1 hypothetical protein [Actinoallomurus soli]
MSDTGRDHPPERDRGVGAHSGHESRPQERVVPGTMSAGEGYETEAEGTRQGDPLSGVETRPGTASREAGLTDEHAPDTNPDGTPRPRD